jgi:hypothetical protein
MFRSRIVTVAALLLSAAPLASADVVQLRITVENLAPRNSVSFAPLRFGFHDGTFDYFNSGEAANAAAISIAEGGSGADFFPLFASQQPGGVSGTVVPNPPGPLLPGGIATAVVSVDSAVNRYFTFGAMVVPSNDYFIGNDSPTEYMIFDAMGNLARNSIMQRARDIWDAGSEVDGPFGSAFLVGSSNGDRIADNGVVGFDFADLATNFDGLTTAAGYVFESQLTADTGVYRITFEVVPTPGTLALAGLTGLAAFRRRRA